MKQRQVPAERKGEFGIGDVWTFTSIDPTTKLISTWLIGRRDATSARQFLVDLGRRIRGRFQLTSDGASFYREAAEAAFGGQIDYAQLVRSADSERTYSPPVCVAAVPTRISGDPDVANISTSHVERQNLTMRMSMRRFTRLTNAFSKKVYNLSCSVALYVFHYNFRAPAHDAHQGRARQADNARDGRRAGQQAVDDGRYRRVDRAAGGDGPGRGPPAQGPADFRLVATRAPNRVLLFRPSAGRGRMLLRLWRI